MFAVSLNSKTVVHPRFPSGSRRVRRNIPAHWVSKREQADRFASLDSNIRLRPPGAKAAPSPPLRPEGNLHHVSRQGVAATSTLIPWDRGGFQGCGSGAEDPELAAAGIQTPRVGHDVD